MRKNRESARTKGLSALPLIFLLAPVFLHGQIGLHVDENQDVLIGKNLQGFGNKVIWSSQKAAFRAGGANFGVWDPDSLGSFSTAFGFRNLANGSYSMAWGEVNRAQGFNSTAWGIFNNLWVIMRQFGVCEMTYSQPHQRFGVPTTLLFLI